MGLGWENGWFIVEKMEENSTFLKKYAAGNWYFDSKSEFLSQLFDRFLIQTHKHMMVYEIRDQMKDFWWWNGEEISHIWLCFCWIFERERERERIGRRRWFDGFWQSVGGILLTFGSIHMELGKGIYSLSPLLNACTCKSWVASKLD